jgi:DNA-binding NtrC family response regulator
MGAASRLAEVVLPGAIPSDFAEGATNFHGLIGRSPAMRQVIRQMQRVAPHLTLALIEGEDGTGKTTAVRALHAAGPAADRPIVPCRAVHFFRGANPDSDPGWSREILHQAHRGVLFLDRIHQLSRPQQELLDSFLHEWEDRLYLHESAASPAGVAPAGPAQILFSTSIELRGADRPQISGCPAGFSDRLASKLCAIRFRLPPLRERREDIPLLAQLFVQRFAATYGKPVRGLGPGTIAPLLRHSWPGNVRELEQALVAACVQTESQWIRPIDLPPLLAGGTGRLPVAGESVADLDDTLNLDHAIRYHVSRVLERVRGNKLRAAQLLGISRSTLYRILGNSPGHP